jgi:integrase
MAQQLETTHTLMAGTLLVYQRERSAIWQCRFKVDGVWQRASTKERDLKRAKEAAKKLYLTAEIRKEQNMPVLTRRFKDVAKLAVAKMQQRLKEGTGKVAFNDYIPIINAYLIPAFGNRLITNIDKAALEHLDKERIKRMRKEPTHSTMLSHNAALNAVFDEAVARNFLNDLNRPKLEATGKKSQRRPSFALTEVRALLGNFDAWIVRAADKVEREKRELMRDYVEMLLDTGARPGKELMNLKWNQILYEIKPEMIPTGLTTDGKEEEPIPIVISNLNKTVELSVSGKTGRRQVFGRQPTVDALARIAQRNYKVKNNVIQPLVDVARASNNDFVLRTKVKKLDVSAFFQKMFKDYLEEHNLYTDPLTGQHRVFYSLRHTYATLAITHDGTNTHVLARQMGTSDLMMDKHYSHVKTSEVKEQLRGNESRKMIAAQGEVDAAYKPKAKPVAKKSVPRKAAKKAA